MTRHRGLLKAALRLQNLRTKAALERFSEAGSPGWAVRDRTAGVQATCRGEPTETAVAANDSPDERSEEPGHPAEHVRCRPLGFGPARGEDDLANYAHDGPDRGS